jgi:hypothetical protein
LSDAEISGNSSDPRSAIEAVRTALASGDPNVRVRLGVTAPE